MAEVSELRAELNRIQRRTLVVGGVAAVATGIGAALQPTEFFQGYLLAFLFCLSVPLGGLALMLLHQITGGSWGFAIRRLLEAATRTLPLMALLFVPVGLGAGYLYEWTHADAVAADPVLQHKQVYLNLPFFWVRALVYFAIWIGFSVWIGRLVARQDRMPDQRITHKMRTIAGPGLGLYTLAMTFASVDWAMSLEPHWFSTLYGVIFIVGQVLTTFAFAIVMSGELSKREPFSRWMSADHFHDLGKLFFAFVMLWAYVAYSQYLIIWSANLAEETPWYLRRSGNGWQAVALFLIAVHFFLPFVVLLTRTVKRNPRALATIAVCMFGLRFVDLYWLIVPAFHEQLTFHWLYVATPLAMVSLWFSYFLHQLKGRPLISLQDGHLEHVLEQPAKVS